jgi:hypothetical protein
MNHLFEEIVKVLYVYCTDFIIHLTHIFSLSYYEVNFIIFCVFYPLIFVGSIALYAVQKWRLYKLEKQP